MNGEEKLNPNHTRIRSVLRTAGPIMLGTGVIFIIIGLGSFFSSFGSFEPPRYFWCAFVGGPLVAFGSMLTSTGFAGAIARYQAAEMAPVGADVVNYVAEETKDGVRTVSSAVAAGLRDGLASETTKACGHCHTANNVDAKFCDECGKELRKICDACKQENDDDAKFCDNCGTSLSS